MLKASELREKNKTKKKQNRDKYKRILEDCNLKIKNANDKGNVTHTYRIKPIMNDMPLIDIECAIQYLLVKLRKNGFIVKRIAIDTLYISWG
jgi:hypothetical protein